MEAGSRFLSKEGALTKAGMRNYFFGRRASIQAYAFALSPFRMSHARPS